MKLEEKIQNALLDIVAAFDETAEPLNSNLERIRNFTRATVPTLMLEDVATADGVCSTIDRMRDARINSGFTWRDMRFQSRQSDRENIIGAGQLAMAYIGAGGDPNSLRWSNPDADFEWILDDNGRVSMSALDVTGLLQAGIAYKAAQTFYARELKDAVNAAEDPTSVNIVSGWPD